MGPSIPFSLERTSQVQVTDASQAPASLRLIRLRAPEPGFDELPADLTLRSPTVTRLAAVARYSDGRDVLVSARFEDGIAGDESTQVLYTLRPPSPSLPREVSRSTVKAVYRGVESPLYQVRATNDVDESGDGGNGNM